jgi:N-acylneuraminate cytidylyltransferase
MKSICVIPARGGSKRIPHKNIIDFYGKPLIGWTIEAALKADIFNAIYVSTEDDEIIKMCSIYPIEIIKRRACYDDHSTVQQATIETLKQIEEERGEVYGTVVQLMANCPLRDWADITDAWDNYWQCKAKFQLSCCDYGFTNPWWAMETPEHPRPLFPKALKMRSQDLQKVYCPSGAIWIADVAELMKHQTFYAPGYILFPLDRNNALDIDDYNDLELAKRIKRSDIDAE